MFIRSRFYNLNRTGVVHNLSRLNECNNGYKILDSNKYTIYNNYNYNRNNNNSNSKSLFNENNNNNNKYKYISILKNKGDRLYSSSKEYFKKLDDGYYLIKNKNDSETFLLGVTKDKFKDFKEIVFINFTDEKEVKKGEYLFSVEDSKTLFDFYSPLECEIKEVNPKFSKGVSEEKLKELFDSPEMEDNYLVRVKLKKD